MTDDLVSIRMLIASQRTAERDLWHQAVGLASVPIEVVTAGSPVEACAALEGGGIDIVLMVGELPHPHRAAICRAARAARTHPIVVVTAADGEDVAGLEGDGIVTKPSTLAEAEYLIDRMLHARLPSRVLLVDDSSTMRSIVRKILQATKFPLEITDAAEGKAALEQLRTGHFDIIFLDYNMPGLNGLDTLAQIRRDYPRLEVVMISSTQDETIAARVHAAGAAAFLKKPFFPADIDAVLHAFCGMRPIAAR